MFYFYCGLFSHLVFLRRHCLSCHLGGNALCYTENSVIHSTSKELVGNTHIYTRTSKLVTDATPPPWLQSTTMLTSIISSYLTSMFLSCLRLPFCSYNMFFVVYSSTQSVSVPRSLFSTSLWTTKL